MAQTSPSSSVASESIFISLEISSKISRFSFRLLVSLVSVERERESERQLQEKSDNRSLSPILPLLLHFYELKVDNEL